MVGYKGNSRGQAMKTPKHSMFSFHRNSEPEQLELFQRYGPLGAALCHPVCNQIGEISCHTYAASPTTDLIDRVRNLLVHSCGTEQISGIASVLHEYMRGAALALNPLPLERPQTFLDSDRAALSSDWQVVQNDIDQVWHGIALARALAENTNERSEQQKRRQQPEAEAP
jgi:hypothetical protein